jgi:choline dehydrogenase-like flavoprotein
MLRGTRQRLSGTIQPRRVQTRAGEHDFIVVGGGASAMMVASRLAQENYKTLIVEQGADAVSGNPITHFDREAPFAGILNRSKGKYVSRLKGTVGDKEAVFEVPCAVGGASVVLGHKSYQRGHQLDWAAESKNFPHPFEDSGLILYYKKLEAVEGTHLHRGQQGRFMISRGKTVSKMYQPLLEAFTQSGVTLLHDFNSPYGFKGTGIGRTEALIDGITGINCSGACQYYKYTRDFKRPLTIRAKAKVHSIEVGSTGAAVGVNLEGGETLAAARGVIMAAGAIGTPQILQRSSNLPAHVDAFLRADRLWSVPCQTLRFKTMTENTLAPLSNPLVQLLARYEWARKGTGWFAGSYDDMVCFHETSVSRRRRGPADDNTILPYPDVRITVQPFMTTETGAFLPEHGVQFKIQLVRPTARGRVTEDGTVHMQHSDEDEAAIAEAEEFVRSIAATATPKALKVDGELPALRTYEGPHGGTCAFDQVVDKTNYKITGMEGLHVIDGSIVPNPLVADSVPLAYALAEMGVDRTIRRAPPVM